MRTRLLGVALLLVLVLPVLAIGGSPSHPDRLGFEVKILRRPSQGEFSSYQDASYVASVVVRQLETNRLVFEPQWPLFLGSKVTGRIADPAAGLVLTTSFLADNASVTYDLTITRDDEPVAANHGTVQLAPELGRR